MEGIPKKPTVLPKQTRAAISKGFQEIPQVSQRSPKILPHRVSSRYFLYPKSRKAQEKCMEWF